MNKEEIEKALWPLKYSNKGPYKFAEKFTPLSPEQAQETIDRFFKNFPPLEQFTKEAKEAKESEDKT